MLRIHTHTHTHTQTNTNTHTHTQTHTRTHTHTHKAKPVAAVVTWLHNVANHYRITNEIRILYWYRRAKIGLK